jgi:hypothetical protein
MAEVLDLQAHVAYGEDDPGAFDDAEEVADADHFLSGADTLGRIEELVADMVHSLSMGQLPSLELVSRSRKNATYQAAAGQDDEDAIAGADHVRK